MDPVVNILLIVGIGLVVVVAGALIVLWLIHRSQPFDADQLAQSEPRHRPPVQQPQAPPASSQPRTSGSTGYQPADEIQADTGGAPPDPESDKQKKRDQQEEAAPDSGQNTETWGRSVGTAAPAEPPDTGAPAPGAPTRQEAPQTGSRPILDRVREHAGIGDLEPASADPDEQAAADQDLFGQPLAEAETVTSAPPEPAPDSDDDLPTWLSKAEALAASGRDDDLDWMPQEEAEEEAGEPLAATKEAAAEEAAEDGLLDDPLDWMLDPTPRSRPPSMPIPSRDRESQGLNRREDLRRPPPAARTDAQEAPKPAPAPQPAPPPAEKPAAEGRQRQAPEPHVVPSGVDARAKLVASLGEILRMELASAATPLRDETAKRIFLEGMFATALLDAGVTLAREERQRLAEEVIAQVLGNPSGAALVQFSAHYPQVVSPGEWQPFYAYLYRQWAVKAVETDVKTQLGPRADSYAASRRQARQEVATGALITATPYLPGFQFNPPSASVGFYEDWHRFDFKLRAADAALDSSQVGFVTFTVSGVIVADVPLLITVSRAAADAPLVEKAAQPYQAIFCSYSHQDTRIVERVEAAVKALGHDFLRDATTLRSGQDWNQALMDMIDRADIFQLFWSEHSAASRYVEQEWRHALNLMAQHTKDRFFIRPVRWVDPPTPLPPSELRHIHFTYQPELAR